MSKLKVDTGSGLKLSRDCCAVNDVTITNEPFVIEGGFVVDVGKEADNALD